MKNHSKENLYVYVSKSKPGLYWCKDYGDIKLPRGWELLMPGNAFLTKEVKKMGRYWILVKPAKSYTKVLGVFAPAKNIESACKLADETKEKREAQRVKSRVYKKKKEGKYREEFEEAACKYLNFCSRHKKLARKIARETAALATQISSGRVGRTAKLSLPEKAELATRAYIRHQYTGYEKKLARCDLWLEEYVEVKREAHAQVDDFLARHRD